MATYTHNTSRRRLLAGAPTALVLAGSPAIPPGPPSPDAGLIALCAAYIALDRKYCDVARHTYDMPLSDPECIRCEEIGRAMVPSLHALEDEIAATPARTVAGIKAKAEATRRNLSGDADHDPNPADPCSAMAWSLTLELLDLLAGAAA